MPAVCSTLGTYMPDGVCQNSITMSHLCQYVPFHQWDLGKALERTVTQGNSLARAFRFLCPEDAMKKQERGNKTKQWLHLISYCSFSVCFLCVVCFAIMGSVPQPVIWLLLKSFMNDFSEDGFLNSKMVALELNLISNSSGSGLYKSTAKYDHSLLISTCMNCINSVLKVVKFFCRLKSQGHPSLFNLLTSGVLGPYWWSFHLI